MNFFQIPKWILDKSRYIDNLMKDINDLEVGSEELLDAMSEEFPSTVEIPKTDEINSYEDFIKIRDCCDFYEYVEHVHNFSTKRLSSEYFLKNGYPITLYVYALLNYEDIIKSLKIEIKNMQINKNHALYKKKQLFYKNYFQKNNFRKI